MPPIIGDDLFLVAAVQIDVELGDAGRLEGMHLGDMLVRLAQYAEILHHVGRDEIEERVIRLAVLGIVVAPALFDIAGEALGDLVVICPIFLHDIRDMVPHHGGEPFGGLDGPCLVAEIGRRRGH